MSKSESDKKPSKRNKNNLQLVSTESQDNAGEGRKSGSESGASHEIAAQVQKTAKESAGGTMESSHGRTAKMGKTSRQEPEKDTRRSARRSPDSTRQNASNEGPNRPSRYGDEAERFYRDSSRNRGEMQYSSGSRSERPERQQRSFRNENMLRPSASIDIYSYLRRDHRKISDLMNRVLSTRSPGRREEIFEHIHDELILHSETEQATFYAALANEPETEEKIEDAEDDHEEMEHYLSRLSALPADNEHWIELFGEFKHAVEHHVHDEETRIFDKARRILSDEDAEQLAEDMERLKEEAMDEAA